MAVTLSVPYKGFAAGVVVQLPAEEEAALRAQNLATTAAVASLTSGAQSNAVPLNWQIPAVIGQAAVAAGASSVTVTNANITANSKAFAIIAQGTADGTLTTILRASCAAGVLTISGNANATAATLVSYIVYN